MRKWTAAGLLILAACTFFRAAKETPAEETKLSALALERCDERELESALERIKAWHRKNGTGGAEALRPGLSDAQIDALEKGLPFKLPAEARALYRRHNGSAPGAPFIMHHDFLSLEDAIALRRTNLMWGFWRRSWLPLFSMQDEYYFLECSRESKPAVPVRYLTIEETSWWVSYLNLTTLLRTAAEALETGAAVYDKSSNALVEDPAKVKAIQQKLNPGATFPYYVKAPL